MASDASVQQKNLESAVLFMQQEHADTLRALHEEINKLQSKCTDLTFQLTMNGVNIEEGGDADSRLVDIQSQLQASQQQKKQLELDLAEQTKKEQQLTQQLRSQNKRHLDERRAAEQVLSSLRAEAEAKANNIAYLTTELHRLKLKPEQSAEREDDARPQGQRQQRHLPAPPRDLLTHSARLRQQRAGSNPRSGGVRRMVGAISAAQLGSATGGDHAAPDISPFLHRDLDLSVTAAEVRKPVAPLPPIGGAGGSKVRSGRGREREVHRVVIASSGGRLTRASVPEVATLAVDQINNSGGGAGSAGGSGWKTLPPTQSHGCQHN